ncbi:MAG: septal ring lytic transglycosylase RlpA family protein [Desulfuromonadales bacterium]|nr:MAG: septal ring lytic transglycosylase RlpA family protein [Desulfuromonadales bacterium]
MITAVLLAGLLSACGTHRTRVVDTPETRGRKGWEKPYIVNGKRYDPLMSHEGFVQEGMASWYGDDFHGKPTSNGEVYDMHAMTAAHKTLPLGVFVRARNRNNGREVIVRINDRGPFVKERIIDFSFAAARQLGIADEGTAPVRIEALGYRSDTTGGTVAYRPPASYDVGSYAVQVAAFTVPDNARRLAAQLEVRYGASSIQEALVKGSRFYRVRVGRYDSLEKAEQARREFERGSYPGSFVVATN